MKNQKLILLILLCVLLGAGWVSYRASLASPLPGEVNVTVTASEFKYDPPTIIVRAGQTVHLSFRNASKTMVHELRLAQFKVEAKAGPGLEDTQTFVASAAGAGRFTCNIPGHEGMVGEFIVQ